MAKIIFFDVDGTLRGFTEQGIRPSVYRAIEKARGRGVKCFVATGRHPLEIAEENLLDKLEFDGYIYLNGSYCVNGSGEVLYHRPIDPSQLETLLELKKTHDISILLMEADRMYIDSCTPLVEKVQKLINTRVPPIVPDLRPSLERTIYQMILFGKLDMLVSLMDHLPLCSPTRWFEGADALDLSPVGGDKCNGIRKVLEYYGIDLADAATVGDGFNDVEMLRMAGTGIAMGNGCDEAKRAAKYIAPDVDDDGLAWAVDKILEG